MEPGHLVAIVLVATDAAGRGLARMASLAKTTTAASCTNFSAILKGTEMIQFLSRKLLYGFAILVGINLLTFVLFFKVNTADDMARMQLGGKRVTSEAIDKWKAERGYDRPLFFNDAESGMAQLTNTIFLDSRSEERRVGKEC